MNDTMFKSLALRRINANTGKLVAKFARRDSSFGLYQLRSLLELEFQEASAECFLKIKPF